MELDLQLATGLPDGYNETMSETPFRWLDDSKNFTKRAQLQQVFDSLLGHLKDSSTRRK